MKSQEVIDLGRFAGAELRQSTALVHGVHTTVSDTVHDVLRATLGPAALPAKVTHDAIAHAAYAATGLGMQAAVTLAGLVSGHRLRGRDAHLPSLHDAPRGHQALAFGLGIRGDAVRTETPAIAWPMHVRRAGRRVELTMDGVRTAYADPTPALVVLVHGLCTTEASWSLGAGRRDPYAVRLRSDLGLTPVLVRYNTGLRISENGRALGELLADLVAAWPVPVTRLVLVGHSMGGLVVHSALAQADPGAAWLKPLTDTVALGSPHHGSPVARGVHRAAEVLGAGERGRWLGDYLRRRSAGVRDLAHGNVVAADWEGHEPDDLADRRTHPAALEGVNHHAVIAVLGRRPDRVTEHVGDLLVPADSARHVATDVVPSRFSDDRVAVVRGLDHLRLLNDERVYELLRTWLAPSCPTIPQ